MARICDTCGIRTGSSGVSYRITRDGHDGLPHEAVEFDYCVNCDPEYLKQGQRRPQQEYARSPQPAFAVPADFWRGAPEPAVDLYQSLVERNKPADPAVEAAITEGLVELTKGPVEVYTDVEMSSPSGRVSPRLEKLLSEWPTLDLSSTAVIGRHLQPASAWLYSDVYDAGGLTRAFHQIPNVEDPVGVAGHFAAVSTALGYLPASPDIL